MRKVQPKQMIEQERISFINQCPSDQRGKVVVYWMQQSQRAEYNHALEYSVFRANQLGVPVVVIFVLVDNFPEANQRHYSFMLQGLSGVGCALRRRGVAFGLIKGQPEEEVARLVGELAAALVVTDKGYLNIQRQWRSKVAESLSVQMVEVESDVIVPVEVASDHEEFAARTLRPKLKKHLDYFLKPLRAIPVKHSCGSSVALALKKEGLDWENPSKLLAEMHLSQEVPVVKEWTGGHVAALGRLKNFCEFGLKNYARERNLPTREALSGLSPYLHFGQISALEIALTVSKYVARKLPDQSGAEAVIWKESLDAYLEELIVRRELAMNFCHYNHGYDRYRRAVPRWAEDSLEKHAADPRPFLYTLPQLEAGETADSIWNACQREMVIGGKMHGYMRMYWGKKIIEWSESPEAAFERMLYLNNKYELDGRDPNGFTGVAWCFGKHDRPWGPERPIFGLVRYMNEAGIKRKIKDWPEYLRRWYNE